MTVFALVGMLISQGCSLAGSAAVTANSFAESGINPAMTGRSGTGLVSWAGPRRARLLATLGNAWRDARGQVQFLVTELRETGLWQPACEARDPAVAARVFMLEGLRPRSRDPRYREGLARSIYGRLVAEGMR